ncbi:MAG: glutaredoxin domain-containing protein [Polyangiaceae bacterium]
MRRRDFLLLCSGALVTAPLVACGKKSLGTPGTVVRDDTKGLLFTWIDASGEYHVEESAPAVPFEGRDYVRVVDPSHDEGANIVIVDLRNTKSDGTYPVHYVTRSEFEGVAANRKKQRSTASSAPSGAGKPTASGNNEGVIIYGASWCKPCHMAAAHFKRRGVPFIEKDIEEDPAAAKEMQRKLSASGKRGGSIPVIDVRGRILLGFDSEAVDAALEATK